MSDLPCGFEFRKGVRCLAPESHDVHHGRWPKGREPNHDYQPFDRRQGERRAAASPEPECVCEGDFPRHCGPECKCWHHPASQGDEGLRCSCGGRRWVEDENWQSDYPGRERVETDGLIPCGFCNPSGWDTPQWMPVSILAPASQGDEGVRAALIVTSDTHQSAVPVAEVLRSFITQGRRFRGMWVQWEGDGTGRARKGEVVVSVQFDHYGVVQAEEGRGATVRAAGDALLAALAAEEERHG